MRAFYPVANKGVMRLGFNGNFDPGGPMLPDGGIPFNPPAQGPVAADPAPAPAPDQPASAYLFPTGEEGQETLQEEAAEAATPENGNGLDTTSILIGATVVLSLVGLIFIVK